MNSLNRRKHSTKCRLRAVSQKANNGQHSPQRYANLTNEMQWNSRLVEYVSLNLPARVIKFNLRACQYQTVTDQSSAYGLQIRAP